MPTNNYSSIAVDTGIHTRLKSAVAVLPDINIKDAATEAINDWLKKNKAKIAKCTNQLTESVVNHAG